MSFSVPVALQRREDPPQAVVDAEQHLQATSDLFIGCGGLRAECRKLVDLAKQRGFPERRLERACAPRHVPTDVATAVAIGGNKATGLPGKRHQTPIVTLNHVGMDGLVSQVHEEWTIRGTVHEAFDIVGEQVGRVTLRVHPFAIDVQRRVDRFPLPWHSNPVVESRTRAVVVSHVPLAEETRAVAGALKLQREHPEAMAWSGGVVDDAVDVRVLAG